MTLAVTFFNPITISAQERITPLIEIKPDAEITRWVYKKENGRIYKRLWNASKHRWETDWILV